MKKIIYYFTAIVAVLLLNTQCDGAPNWDNEITDAVPPGPVSNVNVENINGGAIITYSLPSDNDLMAVKAIYTFREGGEIMESYSSAATDSIKLVGFPDTQERTIQLVAIDKSKNESEPVTTTIKPLTIPVEIIRNSLIVNETFSGVFVKWDNPTRADIGVSLYVKDSLGFYNLDYTYFTRESGQYSFRGYENEEREFRVVVRDRWNNTATPIDVKLTALFEEDVVGRDPGGTTTWVRYGYADQTTKLRGDYIGQWEDYTRMFDGSYSRYFHPGMVDTYSLDKFTDNPEHKGLNKKPMHLTIDMLRETKLNRCKIYFRSGNINANDPYHLTIWATNDTPKGADDFTNKMESLAYWTDWEEVGGTAAWRNDWTMLADIYIVPPSGAIEQYQWTAEDLKWAQSGIDFDFAMEHSNTPFRYLRIECHDNLKRTSLVHFAEWEIYGQIVDK